MNTWLGRSADSVQFSQSVVSDSLRPHGLQHASLLCPSPTPRSCSNSCPSSQWCHPISVIPFSSLLQSFSASGYFPVSQFSTSGARSFSFSISQCWSYSGGTGWSPHSRRDSQESSPTPQFKNITDHRATILRFSEIIKNMIEVNRKQRKLFW